MDNLNFKVSAELKNILGKDLITSPNIAILELVKNSYDAHATRVEITFDEDKLIIADNGKGMSLDDLINKWLFVAYSAKSDGTEDQSYRSKIKRHYAGAKGIGRMSCDRLAKFLTLTTRSIETQSTEILHVDWSVFDDNAKQEFASINIPHEASTEIPSFPEDKPNGTILEFSGLHSNWQLDAIKSLRQSLAKMINPFAEADNFKIEIIAPAFKKQDRNLLEEYETLSADWDNLDDRRRGSITAKKINIVNGPIENSIADVLKLKTTQIESRIADGSIKTILYDRGVKMYEIEEKCPYDKLSDASVSLFFLNRAAKYSFSVTMGVTPVKYGNVFLFRNGIRIWPYGEWNDDSWGLNQRAQQGYNRFLGTRDLFGRVNVETDSITDFKEVSSRDGGLIETDATLQLKDYFRQVHLRLERYVAGVLWGEGFLKKDYFTSSDIAQQVRDAIQENDKDSETPEFVFQNIGSRVDFLQLIKSLVNEPTIEVKYYNAELANIVQSVSDSEFIQIKLLDDLRKVAKKTSEESLLAKLDEFEKILAETNRQKEEAEKKAEEARAVAGKERKQRERIQKDFAAQKLQNQYLNKNREVSREVEDLMHIVLISSTELGSLVASQKILLNDDVFNKKLLTELTRDIEFNVERIHILSSLITKANVSMLRDSTDVDLWTYSKEFLSFFTRNMLWSFESDGSESYVKKLPILELSIILQNLVSNSRKANATSALVKIYKSGKQVLLEFSDNGDGVDLDQFTPDSLFEIGVTNKIGGSGIGLHTIREQMRKDLNGDVIFVGNGVNGYSGATFRLIFM